jgi:predicted PurR-regulated permease PerM
MTTDFSNSILKTILKIAGLFLLIYVVYKVHILIIYLFIASILSLIFRPVFNFFTHKLKFNITLASIVTLLLIILILAGLISLLIPLVLEQGKNLSLLNVNALESKFNLLFSELNNYLTRFNLNIEDSIINVEEFSKQSIQAIPIILNSVGGVLGSFTLGLLSVLFITFFFLRDSIKFEKWIILVLPNTYTKRAKKSLKEINNLLSRYFLGLILQITILFIFYTIILLILGVEDAIVIAFLCSLLNLIPYIGPIVGFIVITTLTMTSYLGSDFSSVILPKTIFVGIGYIIAQIFDNFLSQPYIFSNSVKSHPLEIFLVIISGGFLFGVVGMIIAIPLYTAFKVIGKVFFSENKLVKKLTKNL